jgi:hypothetical protein
MRQHNSTKANYKTTTTTTTTTNNNNNNNNNDNNIIHEIGENILVINQSNKST